MFNIKTSILIATLVLSSGVIHTDARENQGYTLHYERVQKKHKVEEPVSNEKESTMDNSLNKPEDENIELRESEFKEFDLLDEDFKLPNW